MPAVDQIFIEQLQLWAILGIEPFERVQPQPLTCSLVLYTDIRRAAQYEDIGETVDYATLCQALQQLASESQCLLVETLATRIAALCLAHPLVQRVDVQLAKPTAIRLAAAVGVRISRSKLEPSGVS